MAAKRVYKKKEKVIGQICGICYKEFIPDPNDPNGRNLIGDCEHRKGVVARR